MFCTREKLRWCVVDYFEDSYSAVTSPTVGG